MFYVSCLSRQMFQHRKANGDMKVYIVDILPLVIANQQLQQLLSDLLDQTH